MKFLTKEEASEWCRKHGIAINNSGVPDVREDIGVEDFIIPEDAGQRVALAKELLARLPSNDACLIWLDDWDVWPSGQWHHLFERFRLSYGCDEPLIKFPAHLIQSKDTDAVTSIFVYALLMLWDCYVIKDCGSWIFLSHDEFGKIKIARGKAAT